MTPGSGAPTRSPGPSYAAFWRASTAAAGNSSVSAYTPHASSAPAPRTRDSSSALAGAEPVHTRPRKRAPAPRASRSCGGVRYVSRGRSRRSCRARTAGDRAGSATGAPCVREGTRTKKVPPSTGSPARAGSAAPNSAETDAIPAARLARVCTTARGCEVVPEVKTITASASESPYAGRRPCPGTPARAASGSSAGAQPGSRRPTVATGAPSEARSGRASRARRASGRAQPATACAAASARTSEGSASASRARSTSGPAPGSSTAPRSPSRHSASMTASARGPGRTATPTVSPARSPRACRAAANASASSASSPRVARTRVAPVRVAVSTAARSGWARSAWSSRSSISGGPFRGCRCPGRGTSGPCRRSRTPAAGGWSSPRPSADSA